MPPCLDLPHHRRHIPIRGWPLPWNGLRVLLEQPHPMGCKFLRKLFADKILLMRVCKKPSLDIVWFFRADQAPLNPALTLRVKEYQYSHISIFSISTSSSHLSARARDLAHSTRRSSICRMRVLHNLREIYAPSFTSSRLTSISSSACASVSSSTPSTRPRGTRQIQVSIRRPSLSSCLRRGGLTSIWLSWRNRFFHKPLGTNISKAARAVRYLAASRSCFDL